MTQEREARNNEIRHMRDERDFRKVIRLFSIGLFCCGFVFLCFQRDYCDIYIQ